MKSSNHLDAVKRSQPKETEAEFAERVRASVARNKADTRPRVSHEDAKRLMAGRIAKRLSRNSGSRPAPR